MHSYSIGIILHFLFGHEEELGFDLKDKIEEMVGGKRGGKQFNKWHEVFLLKENEWKNHRYLIFCHAKDIYDCHKSMGKLSRILASNA